MTLPDAVLLDFQEWCSALAHKPASTSRDDPPADQSVSVEAEEAALVFLLRNPAYRRYVDALVRHARSIPAFAMDRRKWIAITQRQARSSQSPRDNDAT